VGYNAAASNTTGSAVTTVGYQAGYLNTTGTLNTAIGFFAAFGSGNLTNATAIGANATVNSSNSLVLGSNAKVGIGLSSPVATLHVKKLAAADSGIVFQGTDNSTVFFTDNITENLLLQAGKNGSDVIINPTPGGKIRLGGLAQNNVTEVAGKMYANELGGVLGSSFNMVPLGIVSFDASETDDYLSSNAHATFTNLVGNLGTSVSAFGGSNITSADDLGCLVNLNTTVMTGYSSYFVTGTVNYAGNGATGNAYAVASELQLLPPGGAVTNYRVRVWYRVDDFPNVGTCHVFGNFMVYGIR
jgi:hypothetical protein